MPTITIHDQTTSGTSTHSLTLDILSETITVRELIRSRVYQEVQDFNLKSTQSASLGGVTGGGPTFNGLIQPTDTERTLNGYKLKTPRQIDWKPQFEKACEAFASNRILLLIDNTQPTDLDQPLTLKHDTRISFLKLVPLVGG
jgi:hypothetical protein